MIKAYEYINKNIVTIIFLYKIFLKEPKEIFLYKWLLIN